MCELITPCLCGAGTLVRACEASTPPVELRIIFSVIFHIDHTQRYSDQSEPGAWTCSSCRAVGWEVLHWYISAFLSHPLCLRPGRGIHLERLWGNWRCLRSLLIGALGGTRLWLVCRKYHLGWISLGTWVPQRAFLLTLCFPNIPALCA